MKFTSILFTLIVSLLCIACGSTEGTRTSTSPSPTQVTKTVPKVARSGAVTVEIDAYSGRPNPGWTLSSQEVVELKQRLQGLSSISTPSPKGDLGYRGFLIHDPAHTAGIGTQAQVYNGVITMTDQQQTTSYKDIHDVEQWLQKQAYLHNQGELMKSLGK